MLRTIIAASLLAAGVAGFAAPAHADDGAADQRLLIINGNTHRVIYDDGHDDLLCVTRWYVTRDNWGRRVFRRNMRCR